MMSVRCIESGSDGPIPISLKGRVRGHSNLQIAKEIGITEDTAKFHVGNVLGKLGVPSRSKAVALSHKLGLVH